jgi:hypothetical protein
MSENKPRMSPIRVPDMLWIEADISKKFMGHRTLLERARNTLINETLSETVPKYIKSIGLTKSLETLKVANKKRAEFEASMQFELDNLRSIEHKASIIVEKIVNDNFNPEDNLSRVRQRFTIYNKYGDNKDPSLEVLDAHITEMCKGEAESVYERSPKGIQLKTLNDAENACYQVLHAGHDIVEARKFIDDVFKQVGIDSPSVIDITKGLAWDGK